MESPELAPSRVADRVVAALNRAGQARYHVSGAERLSGGASSFTFLVRLEDALGDHELVCKVAPPGLAPVRNRDVLRQARILDTLHGGPVPVPAVLATDPGDPTDLPPLFAMTRLPGADWLPGDGELPARVVGARVEEAVRVLADIHRAAVPVSDAPLSLAAEVQRWSRALGTVSEVDHDLVARCERALLTAVPELGSASVLVHGDYRLGNLLFDGERLTGVLDWEIWSRGDRRTDLAWFALRLSPDHPGTWGRTDGVPTVTEIYAAYTTAAGVELGDMTWFEGFVRYKQAATAALIGKHQRAAAEPDPALAAIADWPEVLLGQCRDLVAG